MRIAFENAGDIRSVDLLSALVALWRDKADGSLNFSRPGATAGFQLRGGEIVLSISSQPQYETAAILSRAGKLDAAALEKLERPAGGDAAIAALQAGLITEREWLWGQKIRAIEILSDLLGWLEGEYSFDPQFRPVAGDWTLPVPRLVLELFLRSRDRTLVEHYLGPSDLPLLRAGTFDEEFETFGLTADAGSVVALIDGRASAEEIAERAPAEEFAVLKLLAALTTLGLVHPSEAAPEPEGEAPSPIRPEGEEAETVREAEPEAEPGPEKPIETEPEEGIGSEPEKEAPVGPLEQTPKVSEAEPASRQPDEKGRQTAKLEGIGAEISAPDREPAAEPPELQPPFPEEVLPERPEPSVSIELQAEASEREFPRLDEPPSNGENRHMGAVLAGFLAVLIVAVVVLVIARSRSSVPEQSAATAARPTSQEN
ncbi:MAG TPA: DUF4388 domain-containing protein, partial [Thermoanaerobaculia bacterium]|nr:DUF4388 domain-containing protein [Thermoanaerobaculia bacterium]